MNSMKIIKYFMITALCSVLLSACATSKKGASIDGDVYTGNETVEYLATGVKDRVFFAVSYTHLTLPTILLV